MNISLPSSMTKAEKLAAIEAVLATPDAADAPPQPAPPFQGEPSGGGDGTLTPQKPITPKL